ncbi:MAG: hypothetical protein ISN26_06595 [Betaproteobacteria bacterium AqS2]|uniref:Uncharacterized protein n=1 Tax=Candidatus Amphirhobacter heronislandensis TaxID=1732024 RepID=A0A930UIU8_9GAMM|nr:hypothetical protein [Betaproteobacteria bacterium AqS2]
MPEQGKPPVDVPASTAMPGLPGKKTSLPDSQSSFAKEEDFTGKPVSEKQIESSERISDADRKKHFIIFFTKVACWAVGIIIFLVWISPEIHKTIRMFAQCCP